MTGQFPTYESGFTPPENSLPKYPVSPRIWPAVVIALAHFVAARGLAHLATTNIQSGLVIGVVPLVSTLLFLIWWLAGSRIPWIDRIVGLAFFFTAAGVLFYSQTSQAFSGLILASALPACILTVTIVLVLTFQITWPRRRWMLLLALLLCTGVWCLRRVESIGGDLRPVLSWKFLSNADERSAVLAQNEPHATATLPTQVTAEDWPAFRGPGRDGRIPGEFVLPWTAAPRELWRRPVGPAWSSMAVIGDYLFTQEQRGGEELVTCYRSDTGAPVWVNHTTARFEDDMGLGPRATPTYDKDRLYTQGCTGILQCLDAATGAVLWKRDLKEDAQTGVPGYGFSSSPLVVADLVIQFTSAGEGKSAIAYKCDTGDIAWMAGHKTTAYTSPHYAVLEDIPQVIMACNYGLQSFVPETGALLLDHKWKVDSFARCTQPMVLDGGQILMGATGAIATKLFQVVKKDAAWSLAEQWYAKKFRPYFNDAVAHRGFCYGFDGERLVCLDLKDGMQRWAGPNCGGQLLVLTDKDMLLVLTEKGEVKLVPATPDGFSEKFSFQAITGKTWNHPLVAHGRLYVRNAEMAACFELPRVK